MVFQDPLSYLNPLMTIGKQIGEAVKRHDPSVKVRARIDDLLELVQLPTTVSASYPHELSGGMRQRVLIAIALGCRPKLLIADEPTTALDVTTQKEILLLLKGLQQKLGMAMILISHDLAVVSEMCERVYVMHRGRVIESGLAQEIFGAPAHPYTQGLVAASQAVQDENGRFVSMDGVTVDDGELIACPYVVSEGHEANGNIASYQAPQVDGESIHYSRVWRMEAA